MSKRNTQINIFFLIASVFIWLIVIAWIGIIFLLASENGYVSHGRSLYVSEIVTDALGVNISDELIRNVAKFIEYAFLAFTVYLGMNYTNNVSEKHSYSVSKNKSVKRDNELFIIYSLWVSVLVAVLDEYFQFFIDGRYPEILDVLVSVSAIVIVLLIVRVVFVIKLRLLKTEEVEY